MGDRRFFLFLYGVSGATALLYQVVWSRRLTLDMGQTAAAISTVLAAFMGGLAAGAALGGRFAPRLSPARALLRYGQLEALIGGAALLVGPALTAAHPLLVLAYADGAGGGGFVLTRLLVSLLVVALPATAMGATLPLAVRWLEGQRADVPGRLAGAVYSANTLGAAAGAALTGFVLIPSLGLTWTTVGGAMGNGLVAIAAMALARRAPAHASVAGAPAPPPAKPARRSTTPARTAAPAPVAAPVAAAVVLGVSGAAALLHEVAWTRVIALLVGPTTYAFSTMLTTFIVGLGLGGAIGTRLAGRSGSALVALGWAQIATAGAAILAVASVPALQRTIAGIVSHTGGSYTALLAQESLAVFLLLLPMTLAFGASFPLAVAVAAPHRGRAAHSVARVYAWNTVGAIAGALAGGFVGLPVLGVHGTVLAAGTLSLMVAPGLALTRLVAGRPRIALVAGAGSLAVTAWLVPAWTPGVLAGGLYRHSGSARLDAELELEAGTLLYYGDGPAGTVTVRRVAGQVSMAINGKVDASNGGDMLTQKLLGHLPLLLHPQPARVAIIGLGSGVTAGAALTHPVREVHSLELSPQVVQASRYFARENRNALADPRSRLIVGDGRSHLRLARGQYDAIVSEPSNPWMAGVAALFTREVFEAARDRLTSQGVFCQWAHTYEMSEVDFRSIVATFLAVFPEGSLWLVGEGDVLLVGSRSGSLTPRLDALADAWRRPGVAEDLARVSVREPESLLALHVANGSALASFSRGAPIQTDDRTGLEFSAPRNLYTPRTSLVVDRLRALARTAPAPAALTRANAAATAATWRHRAAMFAGARAFAPAYDAATAAIAIDPADEEAVDLVVRTAVPAGRVEGALALFAQFTQSAPRALAVRIGRARLQASTGNLDGALETALETLRAFPDDPRALEQLASIGADAGDADLLARAVRDLETRFPARAATAYYGASLSFLRQDFARAAALGQRASADASVSARALNLVGAAFASLGDRDRARQAFAGSLERDPRDPAGYLNLARLELDAANPRRAASLFAEALLLDPGLDDARTGLAEAHRRTTGS